MGDEIIITPNSHKYKEELAKVPRSVSEPEKREKLKPVISQKDLAKKGLFQRCSDTFLSDDPSSLGSYFVKEMLIPKGKQLLLDALQYAFFHEIDDHLDRIDGRRDYGSYYYNGRGGGSSRRRDQNLNYRREDREERASVDYRNIKTQRLKDAESIVDAMRDRIDAAGEVSISELFDLVDLPSNYTDTKWGWTNERDIGVRKVRGAYLIDVTEAKYLD